MKKSIYLAITVTILLGLTNCGGGGSDSTPEKKVEIEADTEIDTEIKTDTEVNSDISSLRASRFTRINETVLDKQTALMWQDDSAVLSVEKRWMTEENYFICFNDNNSPKCVNMSGDTAYTYCKNLTLDGHTDWRMPTKDELLSILDKDNYPTINKNFQNTQSHFYWSSTTDDTIVNYSQGVFFDRGEAGSYNKSDVSYIRCVRDN